MIIGISGMISSGKSSLTSDLAKHYKNSKLLVEFEEDDEIFNTFLKWLYEKKENLTIAFQTYIVESHSTKFADILEKSQARKHPQEHLFLDRFSLEHYIFAKVNLATKDAKYLKAYDLAFEQLIGKEELPDYAIFLDMSYDTFKYRFLKRGRKIEVDNWEINQDYFSELYKQYKTLFIALCQKYQLKYFVIDTNGKSEQEVLEETIKLIDTTK
ncbi:deoxynucleoside kinase [Mycoplasma iguanae]|uniref:Deoxynucleoside kinase n=1 Tax=Mycoplasma iguanae TaxID=292461 RepID=A0ABY5R907_9MOLU|nr:deoxynucleoside kinase [Mycoplasma iguanae]UVD81978.1 deoxynucleoside kinase [Mycoplasma iguanae]